MSKDASSPTKIFPNQKSPTGGTTSARTNKATTTTGDHPPTFSAWLLTPPLPTLPQHITISSQQLHRVRNNNIKGQGSLHEPLKKCISSHYHRPPSNLYGNWTKHDNSIKDLQVEPTTMNDYEDYDDVSEAGSDFTEDYSRHRRNHENDFGLITFPKKDYYCGHDDDEASVFSQLSFGGDGKSSFNYDNDNFDDLSYQSGSSSSAVDSMALARRRPTDDAQHLLIQDPSEFSVEEDPLFNPDGTVRAFEMPLSSPWKAQPRIVPEEGETWSPNEDEDDDYANPSIMATAVFPKQWTQHDSDEDVAGSKPSPRANKKGRRSSVSGMAAVINRYSVKSDNFGLKEPGFHIKGRRKSNSHHNPIVPTPSSPNPTVRKPSTTSTALLSQSFLHGHIENESPITTVDDVFQYSMDFKQALRISPIEYRAPLKDHSKYSRKKRKSPKKEKKMLNQKSAITKPMNGATVELLVDDDFSVASDNSNDSMDAAVCKQLSKKYAKRRKKKHKDCPPKRGRKSEYWGLADDNDDHDIDGIADQKSHKVYAVEDRIEAIFSNKQMIFQTTISDNPHTSSFGL